MKAEAIFLGLKEEEYQSIWWLATTSQEQKVNLKQKTYQSDVWHQKRWFKKYLNFSYFSNVLKN